MVASFRPRMLSEGDDGSPAKCRERRRRRIEMRRLSSLSAAGPSPQPAPGPGDGHAGGSSPCASGAKRFRASDGSCCLLPSSSSASSGDDAEAPVAPPQPEPGVVAAATSVEWYGAMSVPGRSREMEDAISVRTGLCRPELNGRQPVHFFAVFDGHGGDHVSRLCREKMHVFLEEELTRAREQQQADEDDVWREAMRTSFRRMDEVAMNTCACGSVGSRCGCHPMELALGGSTAVAAVLTPDRIVVANCGDSRAVLCRGGKAVPLSRDQKPDRPDELARIEAAGGRVIYQNGARVEGILAMSRAIDAICQFCIPLVLAFSELVSPTTLILVAETQARSGYKHLSDFLRCSTDTCRVKLSSGANFKEGDKYLKPVVTSEPEITFTARQAEDDCLILASDGLWDVLSSELACEVAFECLREGSPPPAMDLNSGPAAEDDGNCALFPSHSVLAASLLTRLALGRKSWDNISVIVVDLKKS